MIIFFKERLEASELSLELTFVMTKLCGLNYLVLDNHIINLYDIFFKL